MSLAAGTRLAHYEILESIGKGGMGEVYRARDGKLGRDVAIKVLHDEFAENEERLARFKREAKVLASLNHPNIASIYGLEQSESTHYLVLELVPGETLAERISRGPIPLEEALDIASKIAEALEEAHEQGIVHRDLKPANVKQTEDGTIKVLDYGLAKVFQEETPDADSSMSPTLTRDATRVGVILGTAAYMSPEQAKGKKVDKRADIWAFGVVLYEMLTGKRAFAGEDVSDTLARVLMKDPDWDALPAETPASLRRVLGLCITKDSKQRARDMGDVRLALEGAFETTGSAPSDAVAAPRGMWNRLTLAFASLFLLAAGVAGWALLRPEPPPSPVARFESPFREGQAPIGPFELMGDGSAVVYVGPGASGGGSQLWIRIWGDLDARPIPGTEEARASLEGGQLGLSPDGREVAFVVGNPGPLRVVPLAGGRAERLLSPPTALRGHRTSGSTSCRQPLASAGFGQLEARLRS